MNEVRLINLFIGLSVLPPLLRVAVWVQEAPGAPVALMRWVWWRPMAARDAGGQPTGSRETQRQTAASLR